MNQDVFQNLLNDEIYLETLFLVLGTVGLLGLIIFFFRKKNTHMAAGWASVKSWLIYAPILIFLIGLPNNWTLVGLTMIAILGTKSFFQNTGMYHRSYFVWFTYLGIIALSYLISTKNRMLYNFMPMLMLAGYCLVPLLRNSYKHMIQYIALSLMAFSFLGWALMHTAWLIYLDMGPYLLIYVIILTEVCDNLNIAFSRIVGKNFKPFNNISPRRSLEGFLLSTAFTFLLAWGLRHLMPIRREEFWLAAGFAASIAGGFGDITMSVIRRDLGIKDVGVFIFGRGDVLSRLDRLIFVAPIFYFLMVYLLDHHFITQPA